jgi:UDPglucose--hexose-1-phosphate uridylyltransferase
VREGTRLVNQTAQFVVYAPFAARAPYEIAIVPTHPSLQLATMDADALSEFADVLQDALRRLYAALGQPAVQLHAVHRACRLRRRVLGVSCGLRRA